MTYIKATSWCQMRNTTTQWVWGPTAHWKLYFSLKRFSKRFYNGIGSKCHYSSSGASDCSRESRLSSNSRRSCRRPRRVKQRKTSYRRCYSSNGSSRTSISSRGDLLLSNDQVNQVIWSNERVIQFNHKKGYRCETNQLPSNQPNEDQLFVTRSNLSEGDVLVGVIDGHGGSTLANVIKARLPYYLHSSLCDKELYVQKSLTPSYLVENLLDDGGAPVQDEMWTKYLDVYMKDLLNDNNNNNNTNKDTNSNNTNSNNRINNRVFSYEPDLRQLLENQGITENRYELPREGITDAIRAAFLRLDQDLINEVKSLSEQNQLHSENQGLALSGCCALVAYILEDELFVANSGDCRAVLGASNSGVWSAVQLTCDHTAAANSEEVRRILGEHPTDEARSCIQYGRLLGRLAPLRAFGDIQFKLSSDELQSIFKFLPNYKMLPGLRSPPYLTAEPDVFHYKLEGSDKFIVLASDGLWDMLSNEEVIDLVAAYISGTRSHKLKERAHLFGVANCNDIINDPNAFSDSFTENVASFLIRYALGGYDQENLRSMLALPYPDVRLYRDDITVSVIFLSRHFEELESPTSQSSEIQ